MSKRCRAETDARDDVGELRGAASETRGVATELALLELSANLHGSIEYCELMAALLRHIDADLKIERRIEPLKFKEPYTSPVDVVADPNASDEQYDDAYRWIENLWSGVHEIMDYELFRWAVCGYRASRVRLEDRSLRKFFIACASLMTVDLQERPKFQDHIWARTMAEKAISQVNLMLKDNFFNKGDVETNPTLRERCAEVSPRRCYRFQQLEVQLTERINDVLQKARKANPDTYLPSNHEEVRGDRQFTKAIASHTSGIHELVIRIVRNREDHSEISSRIGLIGEFLDPFARRLWQRKNHEETQPVRLYAIPLADST